MTQDMFPFEEEQHYYRHKVEIHLALSAVNVQKPSLSRFLINPTTLSLPKLPLQKQQSSLAVAENLLKKLTGTGPTWLPIQQVCTLDGRQDEVVVILYSITMPEVAPLIDKSVGWVDFETLSKNPELLRQIGYACNAYRIGMAQ